MSSRTLVMLLATLAVLAALAVAVSISENRQQAGASGLLFPGLKSRLNDIDRVVVRTAGDRVAATLVRGKSGWTVAESAGYPADTGKLRQLLLEIAEARILEEKTSNPELYGRLKVEDIATATAGGVQLDLVAGKDVTRLIVGSVQGGGQRCHVRRAGEKQSWLVTGGLNVPREAGGWLDRQLVDIPPERVRAVTIRFPDGGETRIARASAASPDLTVLDLPAGRELAWPGIANAVGGALADLEFESVEPAASFAPGSSQPVVARFETTDGLVVEVSTWQPEGGERVRIAASADEKLHQAGAAASAPADGKGAAATPAPRPFAEVKAEADALNARHAGWVYGVPDYKGEQFLKRVEDLLQPKG